MSKFTKLAAMLRRESEYSHWAYANGSAVWSKIVKWLAEIEKSSELDFDEYQSKSRATAIYPNLNDNIAYPALGLAGESGEVCEKVKKIIRDKDGVIDDDDRSELAKELGDVLWYLSNIASELNISLGGVARINIDKLESRMKRNALHGDGDNR